MGRPHAVMIPFPAQGHVLPLMELSHCLVNHGFKITFINTEFTHKRIVDSLSNDDKKFSMIRLVSIPDGLEPEDEDDRNNLGKLATSIFDYMPSKLEEVIQGINEKSEEEDAVSSIISDENMGWAFEVAAKMGIKRAAFWPAAATVLVQSFSIEKLIDEGVINNEGTPTSAGAIELSPALPAIRPETLPWNMFGDPATNSTLFHIIHRNTKIVNQLVDRLICNSAFILEPGAFTLFPKILPIGPLLASNRLGHSSGCFWPEDTTCLNWLDQQPAKSVIYIAFGSFTVFDLKQFEELAFGLELSGKRFLWVTRPDSSHPFPESFQTRTSSRGRTVDWAPQQDILRHPSVACFLSHCGWNSTMEGVGNGVPFLCWPYFADQFLNQDFICDVWKTGLRLNKDENGIITRKEITEKVEHIYVDDEIRTNAMKLMEMVQTSVSDGGQSSNNFENFLEGIKQ